MQVLIHGYAVETSINRPALVEMRDSSQYAAKGTAAVITLARVSRLLPSTRLSHQSQRLGVQRAYGPHGEAPLTAAGL